MDNNLEIRYHKLSAMNVCNGGFLYTYYPLVPTLEGHPEFYKREPVTTQAGHEAWVYFMPELHCTKREHYLPEGRWPRKAA